MENKAKLSNLLVEAVIRDFQNSMYDDMKTAEAPSLSWDIVKAWNHHIEHDCVGFDKLGFGKIYDLNDETEIAESEKFGVDGAIVARMWRKLSNGYATRFFFIDENGVVYHFLEVGVFYERIIEIIPILVHHIFANPSISVYNKLYMRYMYPILNVNKL